MLVKKINGQNIQILNKTVVIGIHVYVLIVCDERRQSLHTNQLVSIIIATSERAPASELGASYSLLTGKIELFRWIVFSTPLAGSLFRIWVI